MDRCYIVPVEEESNSAHTPETEEAEFRMDRSYVTDYTVRPDALVEENLSSGIGWENRLNAARLRSYRSQFGKRLLELIRRECSHNDRWEFRKSLI
jgi:hypothetical protein